MNIESLINKEDVLNSVRYERKFSIEGFNNSEIKPLIKLHPAIFSETYSPRYVNSIYLDSIGFDNYTDTLDGVNNRMKVRIRWYGEMFGQVSPNLELKYKCGMITSKKVFPLSEFVIIEGKRIMSVKLITRGVLVPTCVEDFVNACRYILLVRYKRSYFQSEDKRYRLTLDSGLEYYNLQGSSRAFRGKMVDNNSVIMEIKYKCEDDEDVNSIINRFPFRLSKNSKYITGLNTLMGIN